jgi:glyoxylase-like metal-dependent hydrolase (beta-lactamase superfamily II)
MEIIPNVHLVTATFVNMYLIVDPDGLTVIDTGMPGSEKRILKYIATLGRAPSDVRRIIITHSDADHVGGLAALKAATGARVYANETEAEAIAAGRASREIKRHGLAGVLMGLVAGLIKTAPATVDEFLTDGQVLPVLGGLRVVETFGHTPGHISLFAPSVGVLFAGDSIVTGNDKLMPSRGSNTWDMDRALEAVRLQAALGAQIVCSGHGPVVKDAAAKFPQV